MSQSIQDVNCQNVLVRSLSIDVLIYYFSAGTPNSEQSHQYRKLHLSGPSLGVDLHPKDFHVGTATAWNSESLGVTLSYGKIQDNLASRKEYPTILPRG